MIRRPRLEDYRIIGYYTGSVTIGVGLLMLIPLLTALIRAEWSTAIDFVIGGSLSAAVGLALRIACWTPGLKRMAWIHGLVVAAFSWLVATGLAAMPYWLSGHYLSYLDAMFDVMSGFTTTGVVLIQDLDHIADGLNMWRHVITYVGGQGMIVLALAFLSSGMASGLFKMYVGEAKDERLLPNVIHTAQAIWAISLIWLAIGTVIQALAGLAIGMLPVRAWLHGLWIFMAGWSTGGFAPMTQNILYYHSTLYEVVTFVIFVIGSFNFALHYAVWTGNRREAYRNLELVTMYITVTVLTTVTLIGLARADVYPNVMALLRKGFYLLISGHTTTGFMTVYSRQFALEWGDLALLAIMVAMLFGGSACSTAGGFKGLRIGIIFKAFLQDVRRLVMPESAVVVQKFHHVKDNVLADTTVRTAMLIVLLYVATFAIGTLGGVASGYDMVRSMFESASVTGNVGLSCGVTSVTTPAALKVLYMFIMWAGRMEFMSVLGLGAFIAAAIRGR
ncbi:MAG: TrkH family potassium uptake protein [Chloroflexota bacterium]